MRSLNLLVLRCRDLENSRRFYELLGMKFIRHAHGGPEHLAHEDDRGVFELYPAKPDEKPDRTGIGFAVVDLAPMRCAMIAAGFAPEPIIQNPWGVTCVVRDPDGRRVELKQA